MSDIQRWHISVTGPVVAESAGTWVTYADHVAAVALREEELNAEWAAAMDAATAQAHRDERARLLTDNSGFGWAYEQGQRDEREKAIALVRLRDGDIAAEQLREALEASDE
jgi:hypothetical protein